MKRDELPLPALAALSLGDDPMTAADDTRVGWWSAVREDVRCVLERDPAARNAFEVWTIYPGVQAVSLYRVAHALWSRGWRFAPRLLSFLARLLTNVDIHPGATIGRRFFIDHGAGVVIGETAEIGHDCTLYHGVTLGGTTWSSGKRHPTLGDGVIVGAGAKILGAIAIGSRARVAANSVVIEAVPEGATVVGIPGRVVVRAGRRRLDGIDLDHHLIPDPVGKALGCLLERVAQLEAQLQIQSPATDAGACSRCDDSCSEPTFAPQTTAPQTRTTTRRTA